MDMPGANFFELEAPPPLDKFEGGIHRAPHNEIILSHMENARILTRADERRARKKLRAIEARLNLEPSFWQRMVNRWLAITPILRNVDLMIAERERLYGEYKQLKANWHVLKESYERAETDEEKTDYRAAAELTKFHCEDVLEDLRTISSTLQPLREDIIRRNVLRKRLAEHEIGKADERLQRKLQKQMEREAAYFGELMVRALNQLGLCYRYTIWKGGRQLARIQSVQWERVVVTPDSVQFKVFVSKMGLIRGTINKLPLGVATKDLVEDRTLQQLSVACERPVRCISREKEKWLNGVWFEIDRLGVTDGLVESIQYKTIMAAYPANERHKIPLLLGVKKGRYINRIDLANEPHFLIAGTTGSGKTITYHGIICTLIQNYSPAEIRLLMIDLKEGVAFKKYSGIPHLIGSVIEEEKDVPAILQKLEALRRWRMHKLSGIAEDINEYNRMVTADNQMAHIVVCFDEYGALKDSDYDETSYQWTKQLAMKGRAAGIHLIIGAQTPYVTDVPNVVKANMTFSLVGKQKTLGASLSATGDKQAYELPNIPGRMICDAPKGNYQVQLPMVTPNDIAEAIQAAAQWPAPDDIFAPLQDDNEFDAMEVTEEYGGPIWNMERLIDICINERDGKISAWGVYDLVKDEGITRSQIQRTTNELIEHSHIVYCGDVYKLNKVAGGYVLEHSTIQPSNDMPIYGYIPGEMSRDMDKEVA